MDVPAGGSGSAAAGEEEEGDGEEGTKHVPALPQFPKYAGLTYVPAADSLVCVPEAVFPPPALEGPPAWVALPKLPLPA